MYVVIREGVYQQGVWGVYTTIEKAKKAAERAALLEIDNYHNFAVYRFAVNEDTQWLRSSDMNHNAIYRGRVATLVRNPHYGQTFRGWEIAKLNDEDKPLLQPADHITDFAYDLLNRDPMALDVLEDVLAAKRV